VQEHSISDPVVFVCESTSVCVYVCVCVCGCVFSVRGVACVSAGVGGGRGGGAY